MRPRTTPIPPPVVGHVTPLGHVERPRVAREISALTAADIETSAPDWRSLDVPTIIRKARSLRWEDLDPEDRAACRAAAIAKLREMYGANAAAAIDVVDRCWR